MVRFSHTIVFVSDMVRSAKFYRDALGLPLRFESPDWAEFATGSCNLALRKGADGAAPPAQADLIPPGHCQVGFTVDDLDGFHARLLALGIRCLQEPKAVELGERTAVYADPDGLPISVVESVAFAASVR